MADQEEWEVAVETCRIDLWRGYLTSSFAARLVDGPEAGAVVDASSAFRWRRSAPPDTEEARLAHAELLARLEAADWEPSGEGAEWYAAELRRSRLVPVRSPAAAEDEPEPRPEPEPEPEPARRVAPPDSEPEPPAPRRAHDGWQIAAIAGLLLAIAFIAVLALHG